MGWGGSDTLGGWPRCLCHVCREQNPRNVQIEYVHADSGLRDIPGFDHTFGRSLIRALTPPIGSKVRVLGGF